tara:strand:+ start:3343 stop:4182 length:840 start_codon:yes stop_codon:yes gene_type:complete
MPLPLLAIGAIASAAGSLPKWYQAWKQSNLADDMQKDLKRPDFEIPKSEIESLQSAQAQAGMTRMPGQSAMEGRLDQNTANQINTIQRMGTGGANDINAASRAYGMQQEGENTLGLNAANMFLGNQQILRNELNQNAEWQNKQWQWDKQMPYETSAKAIAALKQSSAENLNSAVGDITGGISNMALAGYMGQTKGFDLSGNKIGSAAGATSETAGNIFGGNYGFSPQKEEFSSFGDFNSSPSQGGFGLNSFGGNNTSIQRKPLFQTFSDFGGGYIPRFK